MGLYNLKKVRFCTVQDCQNQHHAKGYCEKHYRRFLKHNSTDKPVRTKLFGEKNPNYGKHRKLTIKEKEIIGKHSKSWWEKNKGTEKEMIRNANISVAKTGKMWSEKRKKIFKDILKIIRKPIIIKKFCMNCGKEFHVTKSHKTKVYCSKECLKMNMKKNNPMFDEKVKGKVSITLINKWKNDEEFVKKMLFNQNRKPNKPEKFLIRYFKKNNIPLRYVGDFSFWIGPCISGKRRNPDFINVEKKKVLLYNGLYWHTNEDIKEQVNDYENKGYSVFCINDNEDINQAMEPLRGWLK